MSQPSLSISPEKMRQYRQTARAREAAHRRRVAERRERAWEVARSAAQMLKEEFGVQRVVLFGSLTNPRRFHLRSDVDLAVWGLDERQYYRAAGRVLGLDAEIEIDVVEFEHAQPLAQEEIEREGVPL